MENIKFLVVGTYEFENLDIFINNFGIIRLSRIGSPERTWTLRAQSQAGTKSFPENREKGHHLSNETSKFHGFDINLSSQRSVQNKGEGHSKEFSDSN